MSNSQKKWADLASLNQQKMRDLWSKYGNILAL